MRKGLTIVGGGRGEKQCYYAEGISWLENKRMIKKRQENQCHGKANNGKKERRTGNKMSGTKLS